MIHRALSLSPLRRVLLIVGILLLPSLDYAKIQPGDSNPRWYADFSLKLNLTEIAAVIAADPHERNSFPGDTRQLLREEITPPGDGLLHIHAAEYQEDVRQYWLHATPQAPLGMAFFLVSAPYVLQQQIVTECPMLMAASYLLVAEVFAYVEKMEYAVEKYEVAKHVASGAEDHTDAWAFSLSLKKFEAAIRYDIFFGVGRRSSRRCPLERA